MRTYWLHVTPQPVTSSCDGVTRRLSWQVWDDRGAAVARGCRDDASLGAAIDDARAALRHVHGRADHPPAPPAQGAARTP